MSTSKINLVDNVVYYRKQPCIELKQTGNVMDDENLKDFFSLLSDINEDKEHGLSLINSYLDEITEYIDIMEEDATPVSHKFARKLELIEEFFDYYVDRGFENFVYNGIAFYLHYTDFTNIITMDIDSLYNIYIVDANGRSTIIGKAINLLLAESFIEWFNHDFRNTLLDMSIIFKDIQAEIDK